MLFCVETLKALEDLNLRPEFKPGERAARGFADLGFEEFLILPNQKIISLFTAQIQELSNVEQDHLFLVPLSDQLIQKIYESGFDIIRSEYKDQRNWEVQVCSQNLDRNIIYSDRSLYKALLQTLLRIKTCTN